MFVSLLDSVEMREMGHHTHAVFPEAQAIRRTRGAVWNLQNPATMRCRPSRARTVYADCLGAYATKLWGVALPGLWGSLLLTRVFAMLRIAANPRYIVTPTKGLG
ncbi:MAG TPA: hypothetical protein PL188_04410 [Candidatus Cloacimonadota bacterium]|nr:hypothetical protein [Candidatus Cloacimonadota bacterium]